MASSRGIFLAQIKGLLYRGFLLKRAHWKQTILEISVPILFFLVALCLFTAFRPKPRPDQAQDRLMGFTLPGFLWEIDQLRDFLPKSSLNDTDIIGIFLKRFLFKRYKFGFAPEAYARPFLDHFRYPEIFGGRDNIIFAETEADLKALHDLKTCGDNCISIGFYFFTNPMTSMQKSYKILVHPLIVPDLSALNNPFDCRDIDKFDYKTLVLLIARSKLPNQPPSVNQRINDRFEALILNCNSFRYSINMLPQMQLLIDTALIDTLKFQATAVPPAMRDSNVSLDQLQKNFLTLPYTVSIKDHKRLTEGGVGYAKHFIILFVVLSMAPLAHFCLIQVATDKETMVRTGLKMMGIGPMAYLVSWLIIYSIEMMVCVLINTALAFVPGISIYTHTNPALVLLAYALYGESVLIFALLVAVFCSSAMLAGVFGSIIYAFFALMYLVAASLKSPPAKSRLLLSLASPCAQAQLFEISTDRESVCLEGLRFQAKDLQCSWYEQLDTFGGTAYVDYIYVLLVDIAIYGVLCIYAHLAADSPLDGWRKAFFFLAPSYWRSTKSLGELKHLSDCSNPNTDPADIELLAHQERSKSVQLIGLSKTWPAGNTLAVENLSFDVYTNQITCLLGHNAAGKTTIIDIMTGVTLPTKGTALVEGLDIRSVNDATKIRQIMGVCPQFDILYDNLTASQHLIMVGLFQTRALAESAVMAKKMLSDMQMSSAEDMRAKHLTNGERRKLSLGIALFGEPKVVFLDEPSTGMDPIERQRMWQVLKRRKSNCSIVLTTHFLEEAEFLADRNIIISKGNLRCIGSSAFLKQRFGLGYWLNLQLKAGYNREAITSLVTGLTLGARLEREQTCRLTFLLPPKSETDLATVVETLELSIRSPAHAQLGITDYSLTMASLEDVFLGLDKDVDLSQDYTTQSSFDSMFGFDERKSASPTLSFFLLVRLWLVMASRTMLSILARVLLPLFLLICGFLLLDYISSIYASFSDISKTYDKGTLWVIDDNCSIDSFNNKSEKMFEQWFRRPTTYTPTFPYATVFGTFDLILQCDTHFLHQIFTLINTLDTSSNKANVSEKYEEYRNKILAAQLSSEEQFFDNPTVRQFFRFPMRQWVVYTSDTLYHSMPYTVNVLSNYYYHSAMQLWNLEMPEKISGKLPGIQTSLGTLENAPIYFVSLEVIWATVMIGFTFLFPATSYAAELVRDRQIQARSQLRTNGVRDSIYWYSLLSSHLLQSAIVTCLLPIVVAVFDVQTLNHSIVHLITFGLTATYSVQVILFGYVCSFGFDRMETCINSLPTIMILVGFFPFMLPSTLHIKHLEYWAVFSHRMLCVFDPLYIVFGGMFHIAKTFLLKVQTHHQSLSLATYMDWDNNVSVCLLMNVVHSLILYLVLQCIGMRNRNLCLKLEDTRSESGNTSEAESNMTMVEHYFAASDKPLVILDKVSKTFATADHRSASARNFRWNGSTPNQEVISDISFNVLSGEIFGLLGPSGAGKSVLFQLILDDLKPTSGRIVGKVSGSLIGHCPEHNPLWNELTMLEHLRFYATVNGISAEAQKNFIDFILDTLQIREHASKHVKSLSGGTKRKLSFALAALTNAKLVLLDAPSAGMDPRSKRLLWKAIPVVFKKPRSCILTTQSIDEGERLCTRVSIIAKGQLKSLGTPHELLKAHVKGYYLELIAKHSQDVLTHRYMETYLPQVTLIQQTEKSVMYHLPKSCSLVLVFQLLQRWKENLQLLDFYGITQPTLEQVYLKLTGSASELYNAGTTELTESKAANGFSKNMNGVFNSPSVGETTNYLCSNENGVITIWITNLGHRSVNNNYMNGINGV